MPNEKKQYDDQQPPRGWINLSKSGKAIFVKMQCGHDFSVPVSTLQKLLDGQIKGIPLREWKKPE